MSNLDVWYARVDLDLVEQMFEPRMAARDRKVVARNLAKARTRDSMQAFGKLCGVVDGQTRIIADPALIMPVSHLQPAERDRLGFEAQLNSMLAKYRRTTGRRMTSTSASCGTGNTPLTSTPCGRPGC